MKSNTLRVPFVSSLAMLAMASAAAASEPAFIASYGGKNVTLTRGAEKLPVDGQALLMGGDRIKAGKGSYVEVKYLADGCVLRVAEGKIIIVGTSSPCSSSAETDGVDRVVADGSVGDGESRIVPTAAGDETARVTGKTGPVARANLGAGLVELNTGMTLAVGNTVYAGRESTVTVYFVNAKCSYTLPAETYLEITERAPCVPSGGSAASSGSTTSASVGGNEIGLALGAAAVLGGGALAVIALSGDDDDEDSPASGE